MGWVCRQRDGSFLASDVSLLVGEAGLEASAGFLKGRAGDCPLVGGAGSWPSGGQALSMGTSRGCCGLRNSLGSLSAGGWGSVSTQLVVWPETSQHWCLQAVRWGLVLVLMR